MSPIVRATCAPLALLLAASGCVQPGAPDDEIVAVAPGKADNYYSSAGAEFELTGTIPVFLKDGERDDKELTDRAISFRLTAVTLYLTAYLSAKFEGTDHNNDGVISEDERFSRNLGYGDFSALVRNYSTETLDVSEHDGVLQVKFTVDVAGPSDLLQKIPPAMGATAGTFDLQLPKDAAVDPESVTRTVMRSFDPKKYVGELETLRLVARRLPDPANAYPQYAAFMEDGVFDVTFFFGYDYNTPRGDLQEAEELYDWLLANGYAAPTGVRSWKDVGRDSGPFTRTIKAGGKEVLVEVRFFHADQWIGMPQQQKDRLVEELVTRDVFFYPGHAGPYFAFYIDEKRLADVAYRSLDTAAFTDKQQLLVAQGCQTYGNYADMIYAHPDKSEANLDVITTVNYSYGEGTLGVLEGLVGTDARGNHKPVDYYKLIKNLNEGYWSREETVIYGVHGIDGNPQLHPWANLDKLGATCARHSDCGDAGGNRCVTTTDGKQCAAVTLAKAGCPAGTRYQLATTGTSLVGGLCLK